MTVLVLDHFALVNCSGFLFGVQYISVALLGIISKDSDGLVSLVSKRFEVIMNRTLF